jgi:hypothetical protein
MYVTLFQSIRESKGTLCLPGFPLAPTSSSTGCTAPAATTSGYSLRQSRDLRNVLYHTCISSSQHHALDRCCTHTHWRLKDVSHVPPYVENQYNHTLLGTSLLKMTSTVCGRGTIDPCCICPVCTSLRVARLPSRLCTGKNGTSLIVSQLVENSPSQDGSHRLLRLHYVLVVKARFCSTGPCCIYLIPHRLAASIRYGHVPTPQAPVAFTLCVLPHVSLIYRLAFVRVTPVHTPQRLVACRDLASAPWSSALAETALRASDTFAVKARSCITGLCFCACKGFPSCQVRETLTIPILSSAPNTPSLHRPEPLACYTDSDLSLYIYTHPHGGNRGLHRLPVLATAP